MSSASNESECTYHGQLEAEGALERLPRHMGVHTRRSLNGLSGDHPQALRRWQGPGVHTSFVVFQPFCMESLGLGLGSLADLQTSHRTDQSSIRSSPSTSDQRRRDVGEVNRASRPPRRRRGICAEHNVGVHERTKRSETFIGNRMAGLRGREDRILNDNRRTEAKRRLIHPAMRFNSLLEFSFRRGCAAFKLRNLLRWLVEDFN